MKKACCFVLAALFACPVPAWAACGYYQPSYYPTYYTPYVETRYVQIAEVVAVPYVALQFVGAPTVPAPVVQTAPTLAAPAAPAVAAPSPCAHLEQRLAQLERQLTQAAPPPDSPPVVYVEPENAVSVAPPSRLPPQSFSPHVQGILSYRCAMCHTGDKARGEVVLFDAQGRYTPNVGARDILASVTRERKRMPYNQDALPAAEVDAIRSEAGR